VKKKRIKNRELLDKYHIMRCVACGVFGCDPAHIKSRGSGGDDLPENLFPLCRIHHTEQGQIGIATFTMKYDTVETYLENLGWTVVYIFGTYKLVQKPTKEKK